jgi:tyrosyl-tRNA synthetase
MQAYDAYAIKADVQVGGSDQLFNIITAGRKLMTVLGEKPNIGIIMGILPGTDGVVRMSKSTGNIIPINTNAEDMYGKVMSLPDDVMPTYYRLVTRFPVDKILKIEDDLKHNRKHPRDVKMELAFEITEIFYGEEKAKKAQEVFIRIFQQGDIPEVMQEYQVIGTQTVLDVLENSGLVKSRGEGRRLIKQNGVRLDGDTLNDPDQVFPHAGVLNVGKRKFIRVEKN